MTCNNHLPKWSILLYTFIGIVFLCSNVLGGNEIKAKELQFVGSEGVTHATKLHADVCIIGAGSAGIGAALASARAGASTILVEKENKVGGTSTMSYVNNWEPGPGCNYSEEIFRRLKKKNAAGVARLIHTYKKEEPYGLSQVDTSLNYYFSLRRSDLDVKTQCASIVFDENKFDEVVRQMLIETGQCKLLLNTVFIKAFTKNHKIKSIEAISTFGKEKFVISADIFIDCSGNAALCRKVGCEVMVGEEAQSVFGEPSAPEKASNLFNAISLCYKIKPTEKKSQEQKELALFNYAISAHITGSAGESKRLTVNPLGIIEGDKIFTSGIDNTYEYAKKQVDKHWAKLKTYPRFKDYEFDSYAPNLGIRESYRVKCEYILTQHDLLDGLAKQQHPDIISVADHPADLHGKNTSLKIVKEAYGIPYRCLIPEGFDNLLVAGKCAGFSHIAASSCRLSRTMMSLGHAAGFAAWLAVKQKKNVREISIEQLKAEMNLQLRPKEILDAQPVSIGEFTSSHNE